MITLVSLLTTLKLVAVRLSTNEFIIFSRTSVLKVGFTLIKLVKSYMAKFGIDKVRGGSYIGVDLGKNKFKMLQMELGCNIEPKVVNIDGSKIVDIRQLVVPKVDIIPKVIEVKIKPPRWLRLKSNLK